MPFPVVGLHDILVSPFFQPVQVLLNGNTPIWHAYSEFCTAYSLAEGALFLLSLRIKSAELQMPGT